MLEFLMGSTAMGYGIAGMFFLRFWRTTSDRLFLFFGLALFLLALNRVVFLFVVPHDSRGDYPYWVRLAAFVMILLAILDKNFVRGDSNTTTAIGS